MPELLLVEDNEMNRNMLSRRLERRGREVRIAENGAQAIDEVTSEQPDLVLMDLSLPVMDGWEATERLRDKPRTSDLPIVALTAHALEKERDSALEAGCDAVETKPVDLDSLLATVDEYLE